MKIKRKLKRDNNITKVNHVKPASVFSSITSLQSSSKCASDSSFESSLTSPQSSSKCASYSSFESLYNLHPYHHLNPLPNTHPIPHLIPRTNLCLYCRHFVAKFYNMFLQKKDEGCDANIS